MRDIQYEDPLYFYWTNISNYDDYYFADISEGSTASDYIDETETSDFIFNFLTNGIYNVFFNISRILFPYLILLLPFGIIFSLRPVKQESDLIKANWVFIATSIGFLILLLAIIPERRYLFFLFPFFIIFSVIPIQRLVDNGLSTFSFSQKQKKIVLLGIVCIVILLSGLFSLRFEKLDGEEEVEKIEFAKFLVHNLDGNILGGTESRHIDFVKLTETSGGFKNYRIDKSEEPGEGFPYTTGNRLYILKGETIDDLLLYGKDNNVKFLIVKESNSNYEFLDVIYSNSEEYLFLKQVFDSEIENYTKLKLKVFEIKYENYFPLK
jgi:hypothetical protein